MRTLNLTFAIALCIYSFIACSAHAQSAADPDALYLNGKMEVIDTTSDFVLIDDKVLGDIDGDGIDDIALGRISSLFGEYSVLQFGNNLLKGVSFQRAYGLPIAAGRFSDSTKIDLITWSDEAGLVWKKNIGSPQYYDTLPAKLLDFPSYIPDSYYYGAIDYDGDGTTDLIVGTGPLLASTHKPSYFLLYRGLQDFKKSGPIYPSDSAIIPKGHIIQAVTGKFGMHSKPMLVYANWDSVGAKRIERIGVLRNEVPMSQDTLTWISYSDSNGVAVENIAAMDLTGDGVDDLIVSDGDSLYIYRGDDNFGHYLLTRENAYYTIKSPRFLDLNYITVRDFGGYMHTCGDLTGSGVPVLMVTGSENDNVGDYQTHAFFYCGGKALDTYFDAVYTEHRSALFSVDTIHLKDGHLGVVFQSSQSSGTDYLLDRHATEIPHKTNPLLRMVSRTRAADLDLSIYPSIATNWLKCLAGSTSTHVELRILDILGHEVQHRFTSGDEIEMFDVSRLSNGVYFMQAVSQDGIKSQKFTIQR